MLGFILGTSEGKKILSRINEYTDKIAVSTATAYGGQLLEGFHIKSLNTKPLDKEEMLKWMKNNNISILVDASHPYAEIVTDNAIKCAKELGIKYVRYERLCVLEKEEGKDVVRVKNYEEVVDYIKTVEGNILNTTGGNNVAKFINTGFNHRIIHRILPTTAVLKKILDEGVEIRDIIALQGPITIELEKAFIKQYDIKAIITKDSGVEGGVLEKLKAARACNIEIIVIEKPKFNYEIEFNDENALVDYLNKICN